MFTQLILTVGNDKQAGPFNTDDLPIDCQYVCSCGWFVSLIRVTKTVIHHHKLGDDIMTQRKRIALCFSLVSSTLLTLTTPHTAIGHGLMTEPPSRNATCGLPDDQKPHNATIPACVDAFAQDQNGGYQFMSVLTHDVGRQGVTPLPNNVCGFDSETWDNNNNGNTTPWDLPLDWPTTPVAAGPFDITWNISWGPHFDDTEEFVYYITKPGFQYQVGTPLTWSDFEATPFCKQLYDDSAPLANTNVVPDKGATTFKTSCQLPSRTGRHVIYGEWGRNFFTFERFHGCIDVNFSGGGSNQPPVADSQSVELDKNTSATIALSASDADGSIDSFTITSNPQHGTLTGTGASRSYTPNADFFGSDSFTFTARDNDGAISSAATVSITVNDEGGTGPTNQAPIADFAYAANNLAVSFAGGVSSDPDNGPSALSYIWDFGDGFSSSDVGPVHTYAQAGSYQVTLTVSDGDLTDATTKQIVVNDPSTGNTSCSYVIANQWNTGFVAEIVISNNGTTPINGWEVSWSYTDGSSVSSGWNSVLTGSGSGPYSATNLAWNSTIQPGASVAFGFQGSHTGSASIVTVNGAVCN